jgi:hypothetical protein
VGFRDEIRRLRRGEQKQEKKLVAVEIHLQIYQEIKEKLRQQVVLL